MITRWSASDIARISWKKTRALSFSIVFMCLFMTIWLTVVCVFLEISINMSICLIYRVVFGSFKPNRQFNFMILLNQHIVNQCFIISRFFIVFFFLLFVLLITSLVVVWQEQLDFFLYISLIIESLYTLSFFFIINIKWHIDI